MVASSLHVSKDAQVDALGAFPEVCLGFVAATYLPALLWVRLPVLVNVFLVLGITSTRHLLQSSVSICSLDIFKFNFFWGGGVWGGGRWGACFRSASNRR